MPQQINANARIHRRNIKEIFSRTVFLHWQRVTFVGFAGVCWCSLYRNPQYLVISPIFLSQNHVGCSRYVQPLCNAVLCVSKNTFSVNDGWRFYLSGCHCLSEYGIWSNISVNDGVEVLLEWLSLFEWIRYMIQYLASFRIIVWQDIGKISDEVYA